MTVIVLQRKIEHTNTITNNITRPNHNNHEYNVINKVNKGIKHINTYDTAINYYSKKSLDKYIIIISTMIPLILERMKV